jgi:hypothetical protein
LPGAARVAGVSGAGSIAPPVQRRIDYIWIIVLQTGAVTLNEITVRIYWAAQSASLDPDTVTIACQGITINM